MSEELFKCISSKEKDNSVSNSFDSLVNNINFDYDTAAHSPINYEPFKSATSIYKSSIVLDRQSKTSASKNEEADDEDGNNKEYTYTEDNSVKGSIPSECEENV